MARKAKQPVKALTFESLNAKLNEKGGNRKVFVYRSKLDRVDNMLDSARINADDTCYVDKSCPVSEWDSIALQTLQGLLCYSEDGPVKHWFKRQGLTW